MNRLKFLHILCFCILTVLLVPILSSCIIEKAGNRPIDQPLTKWVSEDGAICFETDENGVGYGTMIVEDDIFDIMFNTGAGWAIGIYRIKDEEHQELIELWYADFSKDGKFTAEVTNYTTYFEIGDKFVFYRVDEDNAS